MQRLWAPWRDAYVDKLYKKHKGCVFCRIFKAKDDASHLVYVRGKTCYGVLNLYPYSNGHCMVVPNRHVADIEKLKASEWAELIQVLLTTKKIITKAFKPMGFNIGINIGRPAGAGIPGHVHVHIVPRWNGDHNFMPVISDTRIVSQSLIKVYRRLKHALA